MADAGAKLTENPRERFLPGDRGQIIALTASEVEVRVGPGDAKWQESTQEGHLLSLYVPQNHFGSVVETLIKEMTRR